MSNKRVARRRKRQLTRASQTRNAFPNQASLLRPVRDTPIGDTPRAIEGNTGDVSITFGRLGPKKLSRSIQGQELGATTTKDKGRGRALPRTTPRRLPPLDQGMRSEPLRSCRGKKSGPEAPKHLGRQRRLRSRRVEDIAKVDPVWLKAIFQVQSLAPPVRTVASWPPGPSLGARDRGCCLAAQRPKVLAV
jgi:hypothetical protein